VCVRSLVGLRSIFPNPDHIFSNIKIPSWSSATQPSTWLPQLLLPHA
jgi:hypothetical protein